MKSIFALILLVKTMILALSLQADIVGTFTSPTIQGTYTFPSGIAGADNEMRGFAAFQNGVILSDSTTTCLYNVFFPINGIIRLNNGTLNLNQDLNMTSTASFFNEGKINGNNFSINLPDNINSFTIPGNSIFGNTNINLNSDVVLQAVMTFTNKVTLDGHGYAIDCVGGSIAVGGNGASVLLKNVTLKNVSANRLYCVDPTGTFSFQDVVIILDANYTFSQGTIDVFDKLKLSGSQQFSYTSTKTFTIHSNSMLDFDSGMTFSYDTNSNALLLFQDATAILRLNETALYSNTSGLNLSKGVFYVDGVCTIMSSALNQNQGISIGDGVSVSNNSILKILAESGLNVSSGYFIYKNV